MKRSLGPGKLAFGVALFCVSATPGQKCASQTAPLPQGPVPTQIAPSPGAQPSAAGSSQEIITLEPGKPVERDLAGQTHAYRVTLPDRQYAKVVVEQRGIDVVVQVLDEAGALLAEFDSQRRVQGQELVGLVADSATTFQLKVKARYPKNAAGRYQIQIIEIRPATEQDRAVYQAHKLVTQALISNEAGKYDEALKMATQALELGEKALGPEDRYVAELVMRLGYVERTKGDYAKAEPTLQRAIGINQKVLGSDPQTAQSLDYLGLLYLSMNDYAKGEQYVQQALDMNEKVLGEEHALVANCLMQISLLRQKRGDFETATALLQRAIAIGDKTLQPDDLFAIGMVFNLGNLYLDQGDYDRAEAPTERALKMVEKKFGPDHPRMAGPLQNMGSIARNKKQYARALEYLERAHALLEKTKGPNHPDTTALLINIGNVYKEQGDYAKALEQYQKALSILEVSAGPYHDLTLMSLANLANTYSVLGDSVHAMEYQLRTAQVVDKQIELNLVTGSERQKLTYAEWMSARTDRTISFHVQKAPTNQAACELAALAVLRRKGRVLDAMSGSMQALRQHMKPEDRKLIEQLDSTDTQLARLALSGPEKMPAAEYEQQLKSLEDRKEALEAQISQSSAGYYERTDAVTLAAVRAAIPPQAALIELAIYHPYDPLAQDSKDPAYGDPRYVAYVIANQGTIQWKDLGGVKEIDKTVSAFREALRNPSRNDARQLARVADERIFRPLRDMAGKATQLLISPEGELNLIPFEALVDEQDHYAVERYSISYLTSGRDLLRMQVTRASKSAPLVIADPLFGEPEATHMAALVRPNQVSGSGKDRRRSITSGKDLSDVYFAPLEGTAAEARAIRSLFPEATVLTGSQATVEKLKQTEAPSILHIATHGFFLEDPGTTSSQDAGKPAPSGPQAGVKIENPLLRSGLALAGANLNKAGKDDGILTALEASNLNLWGTKLVTLSACDSGVGEVKTGEGVYGLRRSFFRAGAETLVMSLWPVSDRVTREMMTVYYTGLKQGLGRGEALRQAELGMLKRKDRQHPFYWASFIQSGEWANLNGRR